MENIHNIHNNDNVEIPDPEHDYHGHPNYRKIFFSLITLFLISLVLGYIFSPMLAVTLIFALAIWKAALVVKNFMHLKYEPLLIWIMILSVILILFAFFFGVHPDITGIKLDNLARQ